MILSKVLHDVVKAKHHGTIIAQKNRKFDLYYDEIEIVNSSANNLIYYKFVIFT